MELKEKLTSSPVHPHPLPQHTYKIKKDCYKMEIKALLQEMSERVFNADEDIKAIREIALHNEHIRETCETEEDEAKEMIRRKGLLCI